VTGGARETAARVLEVLFPGRCLACGAWMLGEPDASVPVCGSCRVGLVPLTGPRCRVCGMPLLVEDERCTRCREAEYSFASCLPVFAYAGAVKDLVIAFKSGGRRRIAGLFSTWLADLLAERHPGVPVVPVPPRPSWRGPDAVELVTRELSGRHGVRVLHLLRRLSGPAQKSLSYAERLENLGGRIRVKQGAAVSGHLVVLDDVFTTGATVDACSRALLGAGASRVSAVTLAID